MVRHLLVVSLFAKAHDDIAAASEVNASSEE
jgi:hypothetical protein